MTVSFTPDNKISVPYMYEKDFTTVEAAETWNDLSDTLFSSEFIDSVVNNYLGNLVLVKYPSEAKLKVISTIKNFQVFHWWKIRHHFVEIGNNRTLLTIRLTPNNAGAAAAFRKAHLEIYQNLFKLPYPVAVACVNYDVDSKREIIGNLFNVLNNRVAFFSVLKHPEDENDRQSMRSYMHRNSYVWKALRIHSRVRPNFAKLIQHLYRCLIFRWDPETLELKSVRFKHERKAPETKRDEPAISPERLEALLKENAKAGKLGELFLEAFNKDNSKGE